jgi:hypothetical protein
MRVDSIGWMRRSVLALAGLLAMVVVAVAGPAGQASAAPNHSKLCWTVVENGQLKVYCVDIEVQWPWDKYFECWMCGLDFDWKHDPEIGELDGVIEQNVVKGVSYLGQAEFATDRALAARLRTQALDAFTVAARYSGGSTTTLGSVNVANPERNTADPEPSPWSVAAGTDLADGVTLLQRSFSADPTTAARLRSLAQAQFDEAYQELSTQRVIGD